MLLLVARYSLCTDSARGLMRVDPEPEPEQPEPEPEGESAQRHARFQNSATLLSYWLKVFMLLEAAMDTPSACRSNCVCRS